MRCKVYGVQCAVRSVAGLAARGGSQSCHASSSAHISTDWPCAGRRRQSEISSWPPAGQAGRSAGHAARRSCRHLQHQQHHRHRHRHRHLPPPPLRPPLRPPSPPSPSSCLRRRSLPWSDASSAPQPHTHTSCHRRWIFSLTLRRSSGSVPGWASASVRVPCPLSPISFACCLLSVACCAIAIASPSMSWTTGWTDRTGARKGKERKGPGTDAALMLVLVLVSGWRWRWCWC